MKLDICILGCSLLALSLAACSKQQTVETFGEIMFSRGALVTKAGGTAADFDDFGVYGWNTGDAEWSAGPALTNAVFTNMQAINSGEGNYVTVDKKAWESGNYQFVAYGPYSASSPVSFESNNVGGTAFRFKLADYQMSSSNNDLVFSDVAINKTNAAGVVPLTFHHALSRLIFIFNPVSTNAPTEAVGTMFSQAIIEPTAITLNGFKTSGSFTGTASADGQINGSWALSGESGNIANSSVVKSAEGYDAYVLPQSVGTSSGVTITYNIKYKSGDTVISSGPFVGSVNFSSALDFNINEQTAFTFNVSTFDGEITFGTMETGSWGAQSGIL